jgi:hypothetical protein
MRAKLVETIRKYGTAVAALFGAAGHTGTFEPCLASDRQTPLTVAKPPNPEQKGVV